MAKEKTVLLTEYAQNMELLKKFEEVEVFLHQRRQTKFDTIAAMKKSRSSRFHYLSPKVWKSRMSVKPKYEFVHDIALENLRRAITKQLSIFYDTQMCHEPKYSVDDIPNRLFSWDMQDFLKRRSLDTVWLDVLRKEISEDCLNARKFHFDLRELRRYIRMILDIFVGVHNRADEKAKSKMFTNLRESVEAVNIGDNLLADLKLNFQNETTLGTMYLNLTTGLYMDPRPHQRKLMLEKKWMDSVVVDPISVRYQIESYKDRMNQSQIRADTIEEKLKDEIELYENKMDFEKLCSRHVIQLFNSQIEQFKERIYSLTAQYDDTYEDMDNKLTYNKIKFDKLKDRYQFLTEQLARFREELENWRLEEAKRKSELLRQSLVAEEKRVSKKKRQPPKVQKKGKKTVKKK